VDKIIIHLKLEVNYEIRKHKKFPENQGTWVKNATHYEAGGETFHPLGTSPLGVIG
jgi:hypothetical protein